MRFSYRSLQLFLFVLITAVLVAGCKSDAADTAEPIEPPVVTIRAQDFAFVDVPESIPAGYTTFRLQTEGQYPHHLIIAQLREGRTYEQLVDYLRTTPGPPPSWVTLLGGPGAPLPGGLTEATVRLDEGAYAILCAVPVPGGTPHVVMGMISPLTVTERSGPEATPAPANVHMVMDEYSFKMTPKITAGLQTIHVENHGEQPHEFLLVRLNDGKTAEDVLEWIGQIEEMHSGDIPEAPGLFLNGVSPLETEGENTITVDFTPGEYALICPYPDEEGAPHFVHGMIQQFTVDEV